MPFDFEISPVITPPPRVTPSPAVPSESSAPNSHTPEVPPSMQRTSKKLLKMLVATAGSLLIFTVAALWWGGSSFAEKDITLTIEAPASVKSGDEATYTIHYTNNTRLTLSKINFRLFYPQDSIVMVDGMPTTPESEGFTVDALAPGETGTRDVKVFIVGDKGVIRTARLNMIFSAGTLRSSFQKEVTVATMIGSLPVEVTLVAPPTTVSGQPIQYVVDVRNNTDADAMDMKLALTYPEGFSVQSVRPEASTDSNVWDISSLTVNQGKRYTITGVLSGNEGETKTVTASVRRNLNGQYVDYARTEAFTVISSPLISVSIAPSSGVEYVAFPGDTLRYIVTYANNSRFTLLGLALSVKLDGEMFDTTKLQSTRGSYSDATRTITFDAAGVSDFGALAPSKRGKFEFTIPLKAGLSGGAQSFVVKATARLSTNNVPSGIDSEEVFALDSVSTKIGSQPSFTQSVLYDAPFGSGPLPPLVGSETIMTVRWQITNPGNDIRSGVVSATLPPGIAFKGNAQSVQGAAPAFDAKTKTITWNVGTVPYGTGSGAPRYEATFQVGLTPSSNLIGQAPKLVSGAALNGVDGFTQQPVQSSARDVTTTNIEGHAGEGVVQ
ncbi:MAG: hypothetical protein KBC02_00810 [Candidatus Pacebacteria bacterium]|nr:hypothetical protein [Candidatus Paceibacterota bacterium]